METIGSKMKGFFAKHGPELIKNAPEILNYQMRLLAYIQQECVFVGIHVPKKRPETQAEVDEWLECFRSAMENQWKRESEKEEPMTE